MHQYQNGHVSASTKKYLGERHSRNISRSRLISRTPRPKPDELRRYYPCTTVLVPASLHTDSCYSLFSAIDIHQDIQEDLDDDEDDEKRAPRAFFRRSYVLPDHNSDCIEEPKSPAVTLTVSPFYTLYPKPDSKLSSRVSSNQSFQSSIKSLNNNNLNPNRNLKQQKGLGEKSEQANRINYSEQSFDEYHEKVCVDKPENFDGNDQIGRAANGNIHANPLFNVTEGETKNVEGMSSAGSVATVVSGNKPWSADEGGGSDIPMAVGMFVATMVGTPVFFAAGIKLGMFAGIAGGAMGYTTGKMFADHE